MQFRISFFAGVDKQARAVHQITEVVIILFPFLKLSLPLNLDNILNYFFFRYDQELSELYRNMDSSDTARPNVEAIKGNIQETIHR